MFREFETMQDVKDYMEPLYCKSMIDIEEGELNEPALSLFASKFTDTPANMMSVSMKFYMASTMDIKTIVLSNFEKLYDYDLCIFKFCILCGMRGPRTEEALEWFVLAHKQSEKIANIAKHPMFPFKSRQMFYEDTNDVIYLTRELQDIFIF